MTTNIFDAVKDGNVEQLSQAIAEDPGCIHLDRADVLPLMVAVREGHEPCVEMLLQHGAKVDAANEYGWTVLLEAIRQGNKNMVGLILDYDATPDTFSKRGDGIYHVATEIKDATMIPLLYEWTASSPVDLGTRQGKITPLMLATERHLLDHVTALLDLGADPDKKNKAGFTARNLAEGWPEGVALFASRPEVTPAAIVPSTSSSKASASMAELPVSAPEQPAQPSVAGLSTITKRRPGPR